MSERECTALDPISTLLNKACAWAIGMIPPAVGRIVDALPAKLGTAVGTSDLIVRNQTMQRGMLAIVEQVCASHAMGSGGRRSQRRATREAGTQPPRFEPTEGHEEARPRGPAFEIPYHGGVPIPACLRGSLAPASLRQYVRQAGTRGFRDARRRRGITYGLGSLYTALWVAGKPIAWHLGLIDGGALYWWIPTDDPVWKNFSPGKVLLAMLI
jgi:hypothetical protein